MKDIWPERPKTFGEWLLLSRYVGIILVLIIPVALCNTKLRSQRETKRSAP